MDRTAMLRSPSSCSRTPAKVQASAPPNRMTKNGMAARLRVNSREHCKDASLPESDRGGRIPKTKSALSIAICASRFGTMVTLKCAHSRNYWKNLGTTSVQLSMKKNGHSALKRHQVKHLEFEFLSSGPGGRKFKSSLAARSSGVLDTVHLHSALASGN